MITQHVSFFTGIGAFDIAAKEAGWQNLATCEIDDFCNRVLSYHFPESYHHKDINTFTYKILNEELTKKFGTHWRTGRLVFSGGFP